MTVRHEVPIVCVREERVVSALLVTLAQKHLDDFGTFWKERLRASTAEDRFWDWEMKNRVYLSSVKYKGFVIEYEQMTQV